MQNSLVLHLNACSNTAPGKVWNENNSSKQFKNHPILEKSTLLSGLP